jgi:hypothetical protein
VFFRDFSGSGLVEEGNIILSGIRLLSSVEGQREKEKEENEEGGLVTSLVIR